MRPKLKLIQYLISSFLTAKVRISHGEVNLIMKDSVRYGEEKKKKK